MGERAPVTVGLADETEVAGADEAEVAGAPERTGAGTTTWRVREASASDTRAVAEAVHALLVELGGKPAGVDAIEREAQALVRDRESGVLLIAESNDAGLVGVLGASWLSALHIPGRYGLIQELWVHPSWRGLTIGQDLIEGVFEHARSQRIARVEVGLPSDGFAGLAATEAFYRGNGFELLGARMRRTLL